MFNYFSDFDRTLQAFDELLHRLGPPVVRGERPTSWPRITVHDAGERLAVTAEIPGVAAADLDIEIDKGTLTVRGKRERTVLEGYSVHRQERPSLSFSRSIALPSEVDPDRVKATLKDGVLRIALDKAPTAKPRRIAIKNG
jgi:HSP20 family protein